MKKILVIDNYDSFTYNLVHYLEDLDCEVTVYRNDEFDIDEIAVFDKILLSPGPGIPDEAGLLKEVIKKYGPTKSIFGVCLGQQAIGEVYGGTLSNLDKVYHGVATPVTVKSEKSGVRSKLFSELPDTLEVGRYHSWVISNENFPAELEVTARDVNNYIMALQHKTYDVQGVQFHPESVLTPDGETIIRNWLKS